MKLETLLTRYKTMGYKPLFIEKHLEIANLITWLFDNFKIFIYAKHIDLNMGDGQYLKFIGHYKVHCNKVFCNTFYTEKTFDTPLEAYIEALKVMSKSFKLNNKK